MAVYIRSWSPYFGKWAGVTLSAENRRRVWVPEGFAHGFLVVSDPAELLYKVTEYYNVSVECCIIWNDPGFEIVPNDATFNTYVQVLRVVVAGPSNESSSLVTGCAVFITRYLNRNKTEKYVLQFGDRVPE